jgi:hypothetical protein
MHAATIVFNWIFAVSLVSVVVWWCYEISKLWFMFRETYNSWKQQRDEEWAEIQQADRSQFYQALAKSTAQPGEMVGAGKYQGKFFRES